MMNSLKEIIERCHQRHRKPIQQRKTVATHWIYNKDYPHQYTVYCAYKSPVLLNDLEQVGISFMPIGRAPEKEHGLRSLKDDVFLKRQRMTDWKMGRWNASWGIRVFTGIPSERDGARWHDLDFTYQALCAAPDAVSACINALINAVVNPLLTLSKSGGLRFSCRIPNYLHSNTEEAKLYIYKGTPTVENPRQRDVYLEILGKNGYSNWDARHEILLGSLLDPPIITAGVLFAHINTLRAVLHEPLSPRSQPTKLARQVTAFSPPSLGSRNLDLAKEAFVKRGFYYAQRDDGFHYWSRADGEHVSLWEHDGTVWIWSFTPNIGLPTEAMPITEVWNDTGILSSALGSALPISNKTIAVREGKISPLGIKRPAPILREQEQTTKVYETFDKNVNQIGNIFEQDTPILGLIAEIGAGKSYEAESYVLNGGTICLNVQNARLAEETELRFQKRGMPSFARWKPRMYKWEQVKEIPIHLRMATPFQHGNVCEDPERCDALEKKGGNPRESICPQCPVYAECQQHGYLSQPSVLQNAKAQILDIPQLFLNPQYAGLLEEILEGVDSTDRLCIIDEAQVHELFLECNISRKVLEEWSTNWNGNALGNFAKVLLSALEIGDKTDSSVVKRIRATVTLFQQQEKEIIRQMCEVNMRGRVVERGFIDPETGKELARFTIHFEGGVSAYIPLDDNATESLTAGRLPFFQLSFFVLNEEIEIPMPMVQAIELGILNVDTVANIQSFPTVYQNPDWTLWHQLKRFFAYYKQDANAPIGWNCEELQFWVPPILHPRVKRLLVMSSSFSEQHFRRAFSDEKVEVLHVKPAAWRVGNRVFQIRSGNYPVSAFLDYNSHWDTTIRLSKMGQCLFLGIRMEIERDPSIKHAIITYKRLTRYLKDIAEKDNVCFVTNFKELDGSDAEFEEVQVLWIVGTPRWEAGVFWLRSQILFGNDEDAISYEGEPESYRYKDERVQSVCDQHAVGLLTEAVGHAGLNRFTGKTVVLISSMALPDVTDRPETILFDWEDFEVAGGLDKLPEVIATRERFEAEGDKLTADASREEVERVLGCSARQANRVLQKLRGGAPLRVPFREQILSVLADGEKKTAELLAAVDGYPTAIQNELKRLVETGEIVRVRRGVYALPGK